MKIRWLLIWLSVLSFAVTEAQNYDYPSPVTTSLGLSGASDTTNWSLFSNPSGLSSIRKTSAGVGYHNAFGLSALSARSAFIAFPNRLLNSGLSYVQFGDDLYNIQTFSGVAARAISPRLKMGIRFDYLLRNIYGSSRESAFVFDAGLNFHASGGVRIALYTQNPARSVISDEYNEQILPSSLAVACIFRLSPSFFLTSDINHRTDLSQQFYSLGLSAQVHRLATLRGVISAKPVHLSVGSSLSWQGVELNFSANYHDLLGLSSTVGFAYAFQRGGNR